jgi:exodeoxyribonuclease VII large subunit
VAGRTLSFDFGQASQPTQTPASPPVVPAAVPARVAVPVPVSVLPAPAAAPTPVAPVAPVAPAAKAAFTVAELGRAIKRSLDGAFADAVWVEGEVTGARPASSGHLYFCLRDENEEASVDVAMYKANITPRTRSLVVDGARLRLRGKPSFWSPRGRMQFIAERAEQSGKGALLEALAKLKEKLAAEGLFAAARKRALPSEPRIVGVVTSAGGAVIHDVCKVAFRRGGARILLAPAQVQGAGAAESIRRALVTLARVNEVDVIIVGRGGGSSDDLSCFHDEALVRAIAACRVPVVSAVGHEVDVTLTDFVADARAATPSQAAEMVVPDRMARRRLLREQTARLVRSLRGRLAHEHRVQADLARRMGDPRLALASSQQLLDDRTARLETWSQRALKVRRASQVDLAARLSRMHPRLVVERNRGSVNRDAERLATAMKRLLTRHRHQLERLGGGLDALSPLKVLGRGYAIATIGEGIGERAVRTKNDVKTGDVVTVRGEQVVFTASVTGVAGVTDSAGGRA